MNKLHRNGFSIALALAGLPILFGAPALLRADEKTPDKTASPHGDFKEECGLCHTADAWVPARISPRFDHSRYGFALVGAHRETPCLSCHESLDFSRDSAFCVDCHQDIHEGELGADCSDCHTTRSFIERSKMEKQHLLTRFPLTGVHVTLDCRTCHVPAESGNLTFVNLDSECVGCHREDAEATVDPDHRAQGFSEDCGQCHGTVTWIPAGFSHAGTGFPITGAHKFLACAQCHGEGQFQAVPAECVDCHRDDYDGTQEPDHVLAGFPVDCAACHNTTRWDDADFDHDGPFFPIYSGAHAGRWSSCRDCHTSPANYTDFFCMNCHPHSDQQKTDEGHSEVQDYAYDSQACYNCHPRGRH